MRDSTRSTSVDIKQLNFCWNLEVSQTEEWAKFCPVNSKNTWKLGGERTVKRTLIWKKCFGEIYLKT